MIRSCTPFVLAIDIEPGPRHDVSGQASEWQGFERCVEHLALWRRTVLDRTGVPLRLTWFLRCDEQIAAYGSNAWLLDHYATLIRELQAQGDEFGLHVHPYFANGAAWQQDFNNEERLLDLVATGVREFQKRLGPLLSYRGGDCFQSNALIALLDSLGIKYDLTIEPGRTSKPFPSPDVGVTPNYAHALRQPYHPSHDDFLIPDMAGGRSLWVVPVTTACFDHPQVLHSAAEGHRVEMLHVAFASSFVQPFLDAVLTSGEFTVAVTRTGDVDWSPYLFPNFDYLLGHRDLVRVAIEPPAAAMRRFLSERL
jgi:hypothetical protein